MTESSVEPTREETTQKTTTNRFKEVYSEERSTFQQTRAQILDAAASKLVDFICSKLEQKAKQAASLEVRRGLTPHSSVSTSIVIDDEVDTREMESGTYAFKSRELWEATVKLLKEVPGIIKIEDGDLGLHTQTSIRATASLTE